MEGMGEYNGMGLEELLNELDTRGKIWIYRCGTTWCVSVCEEDHMANVEACKKKRYRRRCKKNEQNNMETIKISHLNTSGYTSKQRSNTKNTFPTVRIKIAIWVVLLLL